MDRSSTILSFLPTNNTLRTKRRTFQEVKWDKYSHSIRKQTGIGEMVIPIVWTKAQGSNHVSCARDSESILGSHEYIHAGARDETRGCGRDCQRRWSEKNEIDLLWGVWLQQFLGTVCESPSSTHRCHDCQRWEEDWLHASPKLPRLPAPPQRWNPQKDLLCLHGHELGRQPLRNRLDFGTRFCIAEFAPCFLIV